MKIQILGCSGGIGGKDLRTTSLLVDEDILIDAGTGVADLSLEALAKIDHVFITHSHLDHVVSLPLLLDSVGDLRDKPVLVYGLGETLTALKEHIFNWTIWPDFSNITIRNTPVMQYCPLSVGESVVLAGRRICALFAEHTVPALGYQVDSGLASFAFTGDTTVNERFWTQINAIHNLRYLLIETAFPNCAKQLAAISKHLCPDMLLNELAKMSAPVDIFVSHLKPSQMELITKEVAEFSEKMSITVAKRNQIFEL